MNNTKQQLAHNHPHIRLTDNKVYFTPWESRANMLVKARELYEAARIFDVVESRDLVAVKLHVGELGNPNYVGPAFVRQILER